MDDLAEFESWHEDFMAWESFQDELERIKGGGKYLDMADESLSKILEPFHSRSMHT